MIQKAFIEVNEDGAESAAATACIVMKRKMVCINQLIINQLIVNWLIINQLINPIPGHCSQIHMWSTFYVYDTR